jgi:UDP-GlcNAc:undecaprenyl-phosphate GlcNAc-1-phosphate transferase
MLTSQILPFGTSLLAALVATGLIAALARRTGFTAPFNPIVPQSRAPAALGGGAGIWLGLGAGLFAGGGSLLFVAALVPALLLGLADDARPLRPLRKLLLQIGAAACAMAVVAGGTPGLLPLAAGILLALVLMNAVNFLDVSDGFAGAVSAVSFAGLFWLTGRVEALAMAGACLGFLFWNWPVARIYMGDAGGHLIGMAGALILANPSAAGILRLPDPALLVCFAVALAELVQLVIVRSRRGVPFWRGTPDHVALRLQRAGVSKAGAALLAAAMQALLVLALILATR